MATRRVRDLANAKALSDFVATAFLYAVEDTGGDVQDLRALQSKGLSDEQRAVLRSAAQQLNPFWVQWGSQPFDLDVDGAEKDHITPGLHNGRQCRASGWQHEVDTTPKGKYQLVHVGGMLFSRCVSQFSQSHCTIRELAAFKALICDKNDHASLLGQRKVIALGSRGESSFSDWPSSLRIFPEVSHDETDFLRMWSTACKRTQKLHPESFLLVRVHE